MFIVRKFRPLARASCMKSIDQRSLGRLTVEIALPRT
jgi:hypothetical protein